MNLDSAASAALAAAAAASVAAAAALESAAAELAAAAASLESVAAAAPDSPLQVDSEPDSVTPEAPAMEATQTAGAGEVGDGNDSVGESCTLDPS